MKELPELVVAVVAVVFVLALCGYPVALVFGPTVFLLCIFINEVKSRLSKIFGTLGCVFY